MTTINPTVRVWAADPLRLDAIRSGARDGQGNPLRSFLAEGDGGEPLRCCLRRARRGESIALISWAPFDAPSPWREVGPVFVHTHRCAGPATTADLPGDLRTGPLVLRPYSPDGAMIYAHITIVPDGQDAAPAIATLCASPAVSVVHVRTLAPQCFLYAATAAAQNRTGSPSAASTAIAANSTHR